MACFESCIERNGHALDTDQCHRPRWGFGDRHPKTPLAAKTFGGNALKSPTLTYKVSCNTLSSKRLGPVALEQPEVSD